MELKVKKLHQNAIIPQYQTAGAACFDLHAVMDPDGSANAEMNLGSPQVFSTGLAFEIPDGYVMLVFSRSGHGFKNDTRLANCVGVIDSDYRGEVKVKLTKDTSDGSLIVRHGDRIAQAIVVPFPRVNIVEAALLSETVRGTNGYGSTGQ